MEVIYSGYCVNKVYIFLPSSYYSYYAHQIMIFIAGGSDSHTAFIHRGRQKQQKNVPCSCFHVAVSLVTILIHFHTFCTFHTPVYFKQYCHFMYCITVIEFFQISHCHFLKFLVDFLHLQVSNTLK